MPTAANLLAIMPFPNIDPIAFSIGPLAIHWYGLAYVAGILLGWLYARRIAAQRCALARRTPRRSPRLSSTISSSGQPSASCSAAASAIFSSTICPPSSQDPIRAIEIWNGGMSFHGGLTGTTIAMILFARSNGIPLWSLFDIVATVVPIGLFFGRIANFVNGELWGRLTDVPWAVVFPTGGPFARHPSQLYEAGLEGIVLLLVLALLVYGFRALKSPGFVTGVFVCGYALSRIFVEFFREPDAQLGYLLGTNWLTMGMVLSLPMILLGIWAMARARRQTAPQH